MPDSLIFKVDNIVRSHQEVMEDFEGPLDLILDLLKRSKIEIQDLKISLLLQQYLEWMDKRSHLDMEVASEFIAMASHLVYLKTKMLLNISDGPDEEVDELISALRQRQREEVYQQVLRLREYLEVRANLGRNLISKPPESFTVDKTYQGVHDKAVLIDALKDIEDRIARKKPPKTAVFKGLVGHEPHPVQDMVVSILKLLVEKGKLFFNSLMKAPTKSEAVASFLAVLELCRNRKILLEDYGDDYIINTCPQEDDTKA